MWNISESLKNNEDAENVEKISAISPDRSGLVVQRNCDKINPKNLSDFTHMKPGGTQEIIPRRRLYLKSPPISPPGLLQHRVRYIPPLPNGRRY